MAGSPMSTSGRERYLESLWIERILQRETAGVSSSWGRPSLP